MTDKSYNPVPLRNAKSHYTALVFPTELLSFYISQTYQMETLTMIISLAWWVGYNNLHATERCIVCPLAFLSEAMTDIVRVAFIKLIGGKERGKVNQYCINGVSNAS